MNNAIEYTVYTGRGESLTERASFSGRGAEKNARAFASDIGFGAVVFVWGGSRSGKIVFRA